MNPQPPPVTPKIFSVAANQFTIKQCSVFFLYKYCHQYSFTFAINDLLDLELLIYTGKM